MLKETVWDEACIEIVCADAALGREYLAEVQAASSPRHIAMRVSLEEARRNASPSARAVVLLDESADTAGSLESSVRLFAGATPVVVVASADRQAELTPLITSGAADFVARSGDFVPVAAGLVERRFRFHLHGLPAPAADLPQDFGEVLRHEVNNPLTGILGNAEMLLQRRDRLPPAAIERLETIADLAVRLRETVRRLSNACAPHHDHASSA